MWFGDVRLSNPTSKIKKLLKELPKNLILPGYVSGDIIKGAYGDVYKRQELECVRGSWNSMCSGEMRRYMEEHQWRRRRSGA